MLHSKILNIFNNGLCQSKLWYKSKILLKSVKQTYKYYPSILNTLRNTYNVFFCSLL